MIIADAMRHRVNKRRQMRIVGNRRGQPERARTTPGTNTDKARDHSAPPRAVVETNPGA